MRWSTVLQEVREGSKLGRSSGSEQTAKKSSVNHRSPTSRRKRLKTHNTVADRVVGSSNRRTINGNGAVSGDNGQVLGNVVERVQSGDGGSASRDVGAVDQARNCVVGEDLGDELRGGGDVQGSQLSEGGGEGVGCGNEAGEKNGISTQGTNKLRV